MMGVHYPIMVQLLQSTEQTVGSVPGLVTAAGSQLNGVHLGKGGGQPL